MTDITLLFATLGHTVVSDIQVPGYVDRDGPIPQFVPLPRTFYLVREKDYVQFDAPLSQDFLTFRIVEQPTPPENLDEDEEFATSSYDRLFLSEDLSSFAVTRIRCLVSDGPSSGEVLVKCAEFEFENSSYLFADPRNLFGIRLAGHGAYDRWKAWAENPEAPDGTLREVVWTPGS
ncbi:hypothetical protein [Streptomyces antarcticus]|uniref:hypothetical protein n=1 Tax=Streptomyces antarcticus TaxID=2996458 RepID=UPI00226E11D4|nr:MULTISPECIES: hypothetical protein [unclassified Streptomyces]MCY0940041.1 hypothetical protein [Streptomyces sp. H34-AA3]MCZ4083705.1 hypothetical protein [Streptomyces sp. H34-S5]